MISDSLHMLRDLCIPRVGHASLHSSTKKIINNSSHETNWELNAKPCLATQKAGRMSLALEFLVGGIMECREQLLHISANWGVGAFSNEGPGV